MKRPDEVFVKPMEYGYTECFRIAVGAAMIRTVLVALLCCAVLAVSGPISLAAPPGPGDLGRSIETARKTIAEHEKTIGAYDAEMRQTVANDPASSRRREEIRILKQYYVREIERLKVKIADDYKKIQEFRTNVVQ